MSKDRKNWEVMRDGSDISYFSSTSIISASLLCFTFYQSVLEFTMEAKLPSDSW